MRRFCFIVRSIVCCRNFYCIATWRLLLFRPYAANHCCDCNFVCCRYFYCISAWRLILFRPYAAIFFSDRSIVCCRNFYGISAWRMLLFRPYAAILFYRPQHCLYFLPLPHGHGSFLPTFGNVLLTVMLSPWERLFIALFAACLLAASPLNEFTALWRACA